MSKRKTNNEKPIAAEDTKGNARDSGRKEYTAAELKAIYAEGRRRFTAAELQKYTVIEDGIPAEQVLKEIQEIHRKYSERKRS